MDDHAAPGALAVSVDLAVLTVREDDLKVLLIKRGKPPFQNAWALPGGFVLPQERLDEAAARELAEETGVAGVHLEQVRTYGDPTRDPRARVVTVAYLAIAPDLPLPVAGSDARSAFWVSVERVLSGSASLAFDHANILGDALERARSKLEYTTLAAAFCADEFTMTDLRRIYELVWGTRLDPRNFRRKMLSTDEFLLATGDRRLSETGRPAALYRRGPAAALYPPLLRQREGTP